MNKQEFIRQLSEKLSGLPQTDIEERLAFYSEMIDDRMEDGISEEEAVLAIGDVDSIARQIIASSGSVPSYSKRNVFSSSSWNEPFSILTGSPNDFSLLPSLSVISAYRSILKKAGASPVFLIVTRS